MQIIREYPTNDYRFNCSLCTAEIMVPSDMPTMKKVEVLVTHIEGHNHRHLSELVAKRLLERIGEYF